VHCTYVARTCDLDHKCDLPIGFLSEVVTIPGVQLEASFTLLYVKCLIGRVITVNNITYMCLTDVSLETTKTARFGQCWPSSGFVRKNYAVRVFI
jgi:hypothetical protein